MLSNAGNEVLWIDAIAEELNELEFGQLIVNNQPDYIIFEAPTPLIKRYWEIIDGIKNNVPNIQIILCGDHVTALPEESKANCKADFVVQGGKWHKDVYTIITQKEWEGAAPKINRDLTRWWLYAYRNGNFKYLPGTYIMSAMDCWHRPGCTFCSWANSHPTCETRTVKDVVDEVEFLARIGFKEIFDDSGTFPTGDWLKEFCREVIERGITEHVSFGCNMRFGALDEEDFVLLAKAGFRMILWGLESVNQDTLNRLNKKVDIKDISRDLAFAKAAGLKSHLTVMFGYWWENEGQARNTYDMVQYWLRKGYAYSAQATICIPYPGTPLWQECKEKNLLRSENWEDYDMSQPIMKSSISDKQIKAFQKGIYNTMLHPEFVWRKIMGIRDFNDLKYFFRAGKKIYDRFGNMAERGKVS